MSDQAVQKEIRGRFVQNDNEVVAKLQILMGKVVSFPLARLEVKQLYIHVPRHETKRIIFLKQSYFHWSFIHFRSPISLVKSSNPHGSHPHGHPVLKERVVTRSHPDHPTPSVKREGPRKRCTSTAVAVESRMVFLQDTEHNDESEASRRDGSATDLKAGSQGGADRRDLPMPLYSQDTAIHPRPDLHGQHAIASFNQDLDQLEAGNLNFPIYAPNSTHVPLLTPIPGRHDIPTKLASAADKQEARAPHSRASSHKPNPPPLSPIDR